MSIVTTNLRDKAGGDLSLRPGAFTIAGIQLLPAFRTLRAFNG
jgi:hypothetical protein